MAMRSVSETVAVASAAVLSVLVIVIITGNCIVCMIILKYRDMRVPINFLLVNLAVSDIMIATFLTPQYILSRTFTHAEGVTGTVLCRVLTGGNFAWVGGASSVFTLVVISVERYYAVMYPYGDKGKLTNTKLKVIIPGCWIFALISNIPIFLSMNYKNTVRDCEEDWPKKWMGIANSMGWFVVMGFLPMLVMSGSYSRVVYTLWFKQTDKNKLSPRQKGVILLRKRVTSMVVIVSAIFGICWITDSTIYFLHFISSPYSDVTFAIATILVLFNSAVNPFVYALVNRRFSQKIKRILRFNCLSTNKIGPIDKTTRRIVLPNSRVPTLPNVNE